MSLVDELIAQHVSISLESVAKFGWKFSLGDLRALVSAALEVPRDLVGAPMLAAPAIPKGDARKVYFAQEHDVATPSAAPVRDGLTTTQKMLHVAAAISALGERETAWLIELQDETRGGCMGWYSSDAQDGRYFGWTLDPNKAIRFARKQDADWMRERLGLTGDAPSCRHISTEHVWMDRAARAPAEAAGDAVPVALTDEQCDAIWMPLWDSPHGNNRPMLRAIVRAGYAAAPAKGDTPSVVRDALRECVDAIGGYWHNTPSAMPCSMRDAWEAARAALAPAGEPNGQKT